MVWFNCFISVNGKRAGFVRRKDSSVFLLRVGDRNGLEDCLRLFVFKFLIFSNIDEMGLVLSEIIVIHTGLGVGPG